MQTLLRSAGRRTVSAATRRPLLLLPSGPRFRLLACCCAGMRDSCPPIPGVDHTLIVYPVPNTQLKRPWPYRLVLKPPLQDAITISPGQYNRAWPYTRWVLQEGAWAVQQGLALHQVGAVSLACLVEGAWVLTLNAQRSAKHGSMVQADRCVPLLGGEL